MKTTYRSRNGHDRTNHCHTDMNGVARERRKRALERLEIQLKNKVKFDIELQVFVPLTEKNIERITKEIATLKTRI